MNSANLLKTKSDRKSDSKADSKVDSKVDTKPLPSIPVVVQHEPEVKVQVIKTESKQHAPETKVHIETVKYEGPDGEDVIPLSDCSGERRAVLVGVNYTGGPNPLNGCVNDTAVMRTFLLEQGFKDENIHVLTDDPVGSHGLPTRENMLNHLRWLIHDAQRNDSYFFHYSGHGGQTLDLDGDETDGKDSCLFPLDYVEKGVIIDDELHDILVKTLPEGVRLTALFDCCHSGSALDLPYIYASTGYVRGSSAYANLGHELVEGDFDEAGLKELRLKWARLQEEEKEFKRQVHLKAAKAEVILFSGCQDDQTSADVKVTRNGNSSSNGAMTYAFTKCVREYPDQSYQEMLVTIRKLLKEKKYKQKPQLSSCREMNMSSTFRM
ncbi:caspase domain-containing protein [Mortierella sp. GBAus27b]|nr:caspase domain-containing protein [Mortierella sp. GBAus27b]